MAEKSFIQWTDATWNIARGCTKVSEGCKFCYMMRDGDRYGYDGNKVTRTKTVFTLPLKIKEPSKIFTSSLTDFFHEDIDAFRDDAWDIIRKCPQHSFQILTKRPERIKQCLPDDWGEGWDNVWLGVSAENQERYDERMEILIDIPAKTRFISAEPLLSPIYLRLDSLMGYRAEKIHWVIIGGESGFGKTAEDKSVKWQYRKCELAWIESIESQCADAEVACFIKQLGTDLGKRLNLHDHHGGDISEFPPHLQIREFPKATSPTP